MPPRSLTLQARLDEVERTIRELAVEHAYAFSADGEPLFHRTTNAESEVRFDAEALAMLPGAVLAHNHPGGRSFSEREILSGVRGQREADLVIHHLLWERLAARGLIDYSADQW